MTPEELADMEVAERRPQSRKSRRAPRRGNQGPGSGTSAAGASYAALHTWEVPQTALAKPVAGTAPPSAAEIAAEAAAEVAAADASSAATSAGATSAADVPAAGVLAGGTPAPMMPAQSPPAQLPAALSPAAQSPAAQARQLWNIEAVDAAGQMIATWRGVQLRDSGPLPRNAAWPTTLLSVFLERSATDLGLDDGLRVTVSCGQPDGVLPNAATTAPRQSPPADRRPPSSGRHAGPERRALNTASAPGTGALAGFALTLRAPVP